MDNSQQFGYMGAPPPPFNAPPSTDGAVYSGGGAGPPMPAAGHSWSMYQHPPPPAQHPWPQFPPFDPSRPPPGSFDPPQHSENPPPSWSQNQWNQPEHHFRGQFTPNQHQYPNSAPVSYQSNTRPDNSAQMYQNYSFTNQSWLDDNQNNSQITSVRASDERLRDEQWIQSVLLSRISKSSEPKQTESTPSISQFKEKLYGTVKMLSELNIVCQMLKDNVEDEGVWTDALSKAAELKKSIQERLAELKEPDSVRSIKRRLLQINKKRARMRRRKMELKEEKLEEEARRAEREALVDKWQMKRLQEVEEKNRVRKTGRLYMSLVMHICIYTSVMHIFLIVSHEL